MTVEEALLIVEQAVEPKQLNKIQQLILQYSWQGYSYSEIAKTTGYDGGYIKDTGSKLWQMLSKSIGEKVNKQNCQAILKRYFREKSQLVTTHKTENIQPSQDWGEAVDTSIFYGRSQQLTTLERWIVGDKCRLVAILGMGGVGKTTLSVKLAEQLQGEFEFLFWRSLRDAPPLDELLTSLLQFLCKDDNLPASEHGKLLRLQERLQASRCLLVLDNFETLFAPSQRVGVYREGYEGYGELLRRVGEVRHQSCLVITSRDTPREISLLQGECLPVRELSLSGLETSAACELLTLKRLEGSDAEMNHLVNSYRGNPLALKIVSSSIQCLFAGKIANFLEQKITIFDGIRHLLKSQVDRLSLLEQQVMYWLAIEREPVSVSELQCDLFPSPSISVLLEALKSLKERSLVEITIDGFTQQPVVMEYVTDQLITQLSSELTQGNSFFFFNHYALLKSTAKEEVRASQIRIIINPLVSRAIASLGSKQKLASHFRKLLVRLRKHKTNIDGYAVSNLLNLVAYLQVNLTGCDFSHFPIWQVNFADVKSFGCITQKLHSRRNLACDPCVFSHFTKGIRQAIQESESLPLS